MTGDLHISESGFGYTYMVYSEHVLKCTYFFFMDTFYMVFVRYGLSLCCTGFGYLPPESGGSGAKGDPWCHDDYILMLHYIPSCFSIACSRASCLLICCCCSLIASMSSAVILLYSTLLYPF